MKTPAAASDKVGGTIGMLLPYGEGLCALAWSLFTWRDEALVLTAAFLCLLTRRAFRRGTMFPSLMLLVILAIPFSPMGLTFQSAPGGPKLVECCPASATLEDRQAARVDAGRGNCHFCSDMRTGFEARSFLVW